MFFLRFLNFKNTLIGTISANDSKKKIMSKQYFLELLMQANHQFIMQVNHINYFLNPKKMHFVNEIGLVALNEKNNRASIVLLERINSIIIDNRTFFIKAN